MSSLNYNGVQFPYVLVTKFRQSAVGDDMGNTDFCYLKTELSVQAILNLCHLPMIAPDVFASSPNAPRNPQDIANLIRSRLLARRKAFSFTFNGVNMIPQPQFGLEGTIDARNGPIPESCEWTQLNNTTILFNYSITSHHWENNSLNIFSPLVTNEQGNNVLFNRWSESISIDQSNFSTRTRRGKFVIRSDNASGLIADLIRDQMAVVGIPPGFIRQSASYTVDPTGLGLEYEVIDKEAFIMPPKVNGARINKAEGKFLETTARGGAKRHVECRVSLEGDKGTLQTAMIETAIFIVMSKLRGVGVDVGGAKPTSLLEGAVLEVDLYNNRVSFWARAMLRAVKTRIKGAAMGTTELTGTPGSTDNNTPPQHFLRGSAGRILQAAAYYDPSIKTALVTNVNGATQLTPGKEVGQAGLNPE